MYVYIFFKTKKTLNTNPCVRFSPAVSQLSILKLSRRTAPGQRIQWTFHWRSALQRGPLGRWRWQRERWPPAERVRGQLVPGRAGISEAPPGGPSVSALFDTLLIIAPHCSLFFPLAVQCHKVLEEWFVSAPLILGHCLLRCSSGSPEKNIHDLPIEHIQNWWTLWFYYWHLLVKHVRRSDGYSAKPQKFCRK